MRRSEPCKDEYARVNLRLWLTPTRKWAVHVSDSFQLATFQSHCQQVPAAPYAWWPVIVRGYLTRCMFTIPGAGVDAVRRPQRFL